jgi:hypothetical protein
VTSNTIRIVSIVLAGLAFVLVLKVSMSAQSPWARFVDPNEKAYSLDVPQGWRVVGGIQRRSPMQPHSVLTLDSPGGATHIVLGNVDAFTYSVLTPMSMKLGFREGSPYSPGGDNLKMLNYRTGQQFAEMTGRQIFPTLCSNVQLVASREHAPVQPRPQPNGLTQGATRGDAFFVCERSGHKLNGYVFSQTDYTGQAGVPGGIWNADTTYSFLTPEGNGDAAGVVLTHIVQSVQINQQWLTSQMRLSDQMANQALTQASAQLSVNVSDMQGTFSDTAKAQQATQEEMHRLLSGFDEYETSTGERKSVPYAAATNWWSNARGQTLGTQGPNSPGIGFDPMTRVPSGKE